MKTIRKSSRDMKKRIWQQSGTVYKTTYCDEPPDAVVKAHKKLNKCLRKLKEMGVDVVVGKSTKLTISQCRFNFDLKGNADAKT